MSSSDPLRSVDGYLSRIAQRAYPDAIVTYVGAEKPDRTDWRLQRPGQDPVGLGQNFGEAQQALRVMVQAAKNA